MFVYLNFYNLYNIQIFLEILATILGIISVLLIRVRNIVGYPIGILNTLIFTYLNFIWNLYGEMFINLYYSIVTFYAWWNWRQIYSNCNTILISTIQKKEIKYLFFFWIITILLFMFIYYLKNNFLQPILTNIFMNFKLIDFFDIFCTSIFLLAMYLMAKMKLEHWILWIFGNSLSLFLYLIKNLPYTTFQYFIFLIISIISYFDWKKKFILQKKNNLY